MSSGKELRAVVAGATGYSGRDLLRLLLTHPQIELVGAFASRNTEETPLTRVHPQLTGMTSLVCRRFDEKEIRALEPDVVFLATPNEFSYEIVPELLATGACIVDLSGAFRLRSAELYSTFYGFEHHRQDLLDQAVYGLTEFASEDLKRAKLVANPGCYPTSALIPLVPLVESGAIDLDRTIICDSKSGVTGAGKSPNANSHFSEVTESLKAYSVFRHRHAPEITQGLKLPHKANSLVFTPHLLPINRGIMSTIYVKLSKGMGRSDVLGIWKARFAHSPFVRIFADSELPEIKYVAHTPFVDIGVQVDEESSQAVIVSALDNLLKGAASQALQNANIALGLDERAGLLANS